MIAQISFVLNLPLTLSKPGRKQLKRAATVCAAVLATLGICPSGAAQFTVATPLPDQGQVRAMKLIAPNIGWVLKGSRIYWTEDNGQDWKDITPEGQQSKTESVFFLNTTDGWSLLNKTGSGGEIDTMEIATTSNGGQSWRKSQIASNILPQISSIAGVASLFFSDTQHGWLVLRLVSSSNFSFGALLRTVDGGTTWAALPPPPAAGTISFSNPYNGWMEGGPSNDGLWFTEDGGDSWERRSIPASDICSSCQVRYNLPKSLDTADAIVAVEIMGPSSSTVATYIASDGGRTLQFKEGTQLQEGDNGSVSARIVDSHIVRVLSGVHGVSVMVDKVQTSSALPDQLWTMGNVTKSDFADSTNGWAIYSAGKCFANKADCIRKSDLLTTVDGGVTFGLITPGAQGATGATDPSSGIVRDSEVMQGKDFQMTLVPLTTATSVSKKQGFDRACVTTTANMDTWYTYSPYYDTSVYLGGQNVSCKTNTYLSSAWISEALNKGWGLMPLWVGPQSTCNNSCPTCGVFSTSTSYVSQGAAEADLALSAAGALGITSGVIYYDMEPYTTNSPTCATPVKQFLGGWVSEIHSKSNSAFQAGVYDVHSNVADFEGVSPLPDAVWLAYLHGEGYSTPPQASELTQFLSGYWSGDQKIMQYCQDGSGSGSSYYCSTYGGDGPWGAVSLDIDGDVEDGPVVVGSGATKPTPIVGFSLSPTSVTTAQALTVTVTVNVIIPYVVPTGTVTLSGGTFTSSATALTANGSAAIIIPAGYLPVGNDSLAASYSGDGVYTSAIGLGSVTVTAAATAPTVATGGSASITSNGASIGGTVNPNGADTHAWFQYGTSNTLSGASASSQVDLGSGSSNVAYNTSISGLSANTPYYFRAVASNSAGTNYGSISSFTTSSSGTAPTVATGGSANITSSGASIGGTVNPNGADTLAWFQYGTSSTLSGASISSQVDLGSGSSNVTYNTSITGLTANTPYYFRAVASNSIGTNYGSISSFTTSAIGKITPTVTVTPTPSSIALGQSLSVSVTVSGGAGNPSPTGIVTLLGGTYSGNGALLNGTTTITIPSVAFTVVNSYQLTATFQGDSNYNSAGGTNTVSVTATQASCSSYSVTKEISGISQPLRLGFGNSKIIASAVGQSFMIDPATSQITSIPFTAYSGSVGGRVSILNNQAFIPLSNSSTGEVAVLNLGTSSLSGYYQVGTAPFGSAIVGSQLYIGDSVNWSNGNPSQVFQMTPSTGQITASINAGRVNYALASDAAHNRLYALNYYDSTASAIDLNTNTVTATIPLGVMPLGGLVYNGILYVVGDVQSTQNGKIVEVSTSSNTVTGTLSMGRDPMDIVSISGCAFIPSQSDYTVTVLDLTANSIAKTISSGIGMSPTGAAVDSSTGSVFIANQLSNSISILTPSVTTVPVVTITPSSSSITTAQPVTITVSVAGASTPTGSIALSGGGYSSTQTLSGGGAQFNIGAGSLALGTVTLTAIYTPDSSSSSTYSSASSTAQVTVTVVPSVISSPIPGSTLTGTSTTFTWNTGGSGVTGYYLWVGTTAGSSNLVNIGPLAGPTATVSLPTNGATIYVRLWTVVNGTTFIYSNYTYTEATGAVPAAITSPTNGSTLSGASTTFTWSAGAGVTGYYLWIGTTLGSANLVNMGPLTGTSATVNLPTNGAQIYVRLYSVINGTPSQYNAYTYTEATGAVPAAITSPTNGSTLTGASTTFTWSAGTGVTGYYLWVGTTLGGNNLVNIGPLAGTSTTVTLPTNGVPIYVRLYSVINGTPSQYNSYTYTEATGAVPAAITSPTNGSTLTGASTTFTWSAGTGVTGYYLWVGTTLGGNNLVNIGPLSGTSTTVNLPTNGAPIYVRLYSVINGTPSQYNAYTYKEFH